MLRELRLYATVCGRMCVLVCVSARTLCMYVYLCECVFTNTEINVFLTETSQAARAHCTAAYMENRRGQLSKFHEFV